MHVLDFLRPPQFSCGAAFDDDREISGISTVLIYEFNIMFTFTDVLDVVHFM